MEENLISTNASTWCRNALKLTAGQPLGLTALRVEASHRSFFRVDAPNQATTLVLMLSPPALEQNDQFLRLARVFGAQNLPVPEVLSSNLAQGYFLMQDLGSAHLQDLYGTKAEEQALTAAIQTLVKFAAVQDPSIPLYSVERLAMELALFEQWFVQKFLHQQLDQSQYQAICSLLIDSAEQQPKRCVHRDYHCRNLLYDNNRLGIVDFQDALQGPVMYDIASLLRDCYHTFDEAKIDRWLNFFISLDPTLEALPYPQLKRWFDFMAIQRQLKAIGIFARLHLRDDKSSHLAQIKPLLQRLLELTVHYPDLETLSRQLKQVQQWAAAHPDLP
ncbi:MAG: aminoglycoside phosphotransferase family protein [bacterium]